MSSGKSTRNRVQGIPIWRHDNGYWYADFRSLPGGKRESLGTREKAEADAQLGERLEELKEQARRGVRSAEDWKLTEFAQEHLEHRADEVADKTWDEDERALGHLTAYLRRECTRTPRLSDVTARRLEGFLRYRNRRVKASSAHRELASISAMLERAKRWGVVERNEARNVERLTEEKPDTNWLEVDEATKVIRAARQMVQDPASRCRPHFHALIATFLLTGGRRSEVLGLTRDAVDLDADLVRIEPNDYRSLKTDHSERDVPLWPQLREILAPRLEDHDGGLLFPSPSGGPLTKVRSALDALEDRAETDKHLTPLVFRHTYAATRIQTLDGDAPVALFTVARELGHRGLNRIEDTYGHLQRRRARLSEVRYDEADVVDISEARTA